MIKILVLRKKPVSKGLAIDLIGCEYDQDLDHYFLTVFKLVGQWSSYLEKKTPIDIWSIFIHQYYGVTRASICITCTNNYLVFQDLWSVKMLRFLGVTGNIFGAAKPDSTTAQSSVFGGLTFTKTPAVVETVEPEKPKPVYSSIFLFLLEKYDYESGSKEGQRLR